MRSVSSSKQLRNTGGAMGKVNKNCPSYDYGVCNTYSAPYTVYCKELFCKWQNKKEFNKVKRELFKKKEAKND